MSTNEATARIKINHLLETAGWRFFDDENGKANIQLEQATKLNADDINQLGDDFEHSKNGFIDFLLLDDKGYPLIVLEAKASKKHPLDGKEQARTYAKSLNCRYVLLSNGDLHYFWDLKRGNPYLITQYPSPDSVQGRNTQAPDRRKLIDELIGHDYVVHTQYPQYDRQAAWKNKNERPEFIQKNKLKFLRDYQRNALLAIQKAVNDGQERFLFEMATGTGKTLTAAALIKLFLRSANASRVLFLVDRIELEQQAHTSFTDLLKNDYQAVIYKANRRDWRKAEIVVTTVQSLLYNNKYQSQFSPTDFDLVISDEAHRSIGGNARAVFEYFIGYKLGLTATPKDYLKKFDSDQADPREHERRILLDTYRTFGCDDGQPTFRYSLLDGVKEGFLINPIVVDTRTEVTTQLLSDEGYNVEVTNDEGEIEQQSYKQRQFEKKFFSETTNRLLCKTFLENALHDPISAEIGKTIVFAVSQKHATKLTQILNEMAHQLYPNKYQSYFAVQVTSNVDNAQQFTLNFSNNNLLGTANFIEAYQTSKARVCVTVGMMTTGYDCSDILNLCLMRPIYSPTDFIQIKGRGTRIHDFLTDLHNPEHAAHIQEAKKQRFKLFDFFANCEYFEEEFDYDEIIRLPSTGEPAPNDSEDKPRAAIDGYEHLNPDHISQIQEQHIGAEGMKIDRMFFNKFEETVKAHPQIKNYVATEQWNEASDYIQREIMDKPDDYFSLDKLRRAAGVDRRLSLREILEKTFGMIERFKSKDELLDEEFNKLLSVLKPEEASSILAMKYFFKAYIADAEVRHIIDKKDYTALHTSPTFGMNDFKQVPQDWRKQIPEYIKDYIPLNQFML